MYHPSYKQLRTQSSLNVWINVYNRMRKKPKDIDSFCWKTGSSTVERNQGEGSSYEGLGLGNQGMRSNTGSGSGIEMLHPKAFSVRLSSKTELIIYSDEARYVT
ncbi:hypothetical protein WN51_00323 [Melipona quadrifasciata]|uniref:Uncharacterized protein n=1 Tax=Melipona quadrifasciata TaxID=166423 RepID=A0A0N0BFD9_9HYME|nr:hypothetical protein WN51_00323 [Melipona quadrifasciata]